MKTSRIPGFYNMSVDERRQLVAKMHNLTDEEKKYLYTSDALSIEKADKMVENAIGTFSLPLGLGLNFLINDKEYIVPMAIEEPSVVASASYMAKIVRSAGGFITEATDRIMIGQIQVVGCADFQAAKEAILQARENLLGRANDAYPSLVNRGGGSRDLEVRLLNEESGSHYSQMLIVHLYVDTRDAMGANIINTMVEALARSEEHTSELQSRGHLVCRLLLEKNKRETAVIAGYQQ